MDKLRMQTANKADENFKKLAAMFPNAVTETINENGEVVRAIDKDVLMQEISCKVVDGNEERYQFTWPDKKKSVLLANAPINKTLRPVREDETVPTGADSEGKPYCSTGSVDFDTTENLYIEGDNLEVLKLLQETYLGKIKMIYIDPPYNTGNDFVYEDDFAQSTDEYLANSGQFDEEGNRMVQNTESNGRFHTDWLNMMYPRLKLAKDLLSEDGVIFISLDDGEIDNLKKISDEVLGSQNYVGTVIWERAFAPKNDAKYFSTSHDFVLVYAKNIEDFEIGKLPRTQEANARYKNPDNDPRGPWAADNMTVKTYSAAYDLILKNKERLLSFEEPTRFIFSHSALREGWDNPNVFQICTLKHSDSNTAKRQEVGRGLRLCVNQNGNRMDVQSCGDSVHEINTLTVIASESYKTFVADLQSDIKTVLYDRPTVATSEYFKGKYVKVNDVPTLIDNEKADAIEFYLIQNSYVDMKRRVTDKYRRDVAMNQVAELPDELKPMSEGIHTLVQAVYDDSILKDMFTDGHESKVKENPLNENFAKKEFQALWREINHKYAYTVEFDSAELIRKAIAHIDEKLFVSELQYTTTIGRQKANMNEYEIDRGDSFTGEKTRTQTLKHAETSQIKYDLIGKIADGAKLTRKSASAILQGIRADKLYMFKNNPEEFISKVIRLVNEQKATMIVEHISYNTIEGEYDSSIFTAEKATQSFDKAFLAKKAIQDYVFTDGSAEKSIERKFAEDLDAAEEVCVYAKLPRTFQIPTPVGNYSPDWAIAFYAGTVKHIFFVAETKGTMKTLELRPIEQAKISCAKKLFNEMSTSHVVYHDVDSYQSLLNIMNSI